MKTAVKSMIVNVSIGLSLSIGLMAQPTYTISTVAGPSDPVVSNPMSVAVDASGNVYYTDTFGNRVRKIDATTGAITTVAGDGTYAYNGNPGTPTAASPNQGDGGPAIKAKLSQPQGIALDSAGNLYISDSFNHTIRKVDTTGVITTIAGTPTASGYNGDGHLATQAHLRHPQLLTVDAAGNVYVTDSENSRLRKIDSKGIIRTMAGIGSNLTASPTLGATGDFDPTVTSATNGLASLARMAYVSGVAVDSYGNIYMADTMNGRIRAASLTDASGNKLKDFNGNVVTDATRVMSTVAGGGLASGGASALFATLSSPRGLAVDSNNRVYIADTGNNRILYLDPVAGTLVPIFPTLSPALSSPQAIALDGAGNIYVAESAGNRIRKITPDGNSIMIAQMQTGAVGLPRGLAVDATGNIAIADTLNNRVVRVAALDGSTSVVAGFGTAGFNAANPTLSAKPPVWGADASVTAIYGKISAPWGGTYDAAGNYYFADRGNHRVRKIDSLGNMTTVAGTGYPVSTVVVSGASYNSKPTSTTTTVQNGYFGDGGLAVNAQLSSPSAVAVDTLGNIYIADSGNNVIRKVNSSGIISTFAGAFFPAAGAPANCITQVPTTTAAATAGTTFTAPGPNGPSTLYSLTNGQLVQVPLGTSTTPLCRNGSGGSGDGDQAVLAQLNNPQGVAVDAKGNVYIADTNNHAIREVTTDGIISTISGYIGSQGRGGDGILGIISTSDNPLSVAVDANGNVFFAEGCSTSNGIQGTICVTNRIRRLDATTGTVTTLTAGGTAASLGTGTWAGDGGSSTKALAPQPIAVAVDSAGNVYFSDASNRVRKLSVVAPASN